MTDAPIRLNKLLAQWGIASRRAVETLLLAGRVSVNGIQVTEPGATANPEHDVITLDGRPLQPPDQTATRVLAFHKPVGVTATLADPHARRTLADFLPKDQRLFPIGRLDQPSSGLLLLTDDGDLCHRLLHPRFKVEKEYLVTLTGSALSSQEQEWFRQGLTLDDGPTAPCRLEPHNDGDGYRIVLREGRKRQIRRMMEILGHQVRTLHRVRFGPILLGNLPAGALRPLSPVEIAALAAAVGREPQRQRSGS